MNSIQLVKRKEVRLITYFLVIAALTKEINSGCGSSTVDLYSGWN